VAAGGGGMNKPTAYGIIVLIGFFTLAGLTHWMRNPPDLEVLTFRVYGDSMLPTLEPEDLVYAQRIPFKDLQTGMIVTAIAPDGGFMVHRITGKHMWGFVTQGDNRKSSDTFVMSEKDYESTVLYWQDRYGNVIVPEYAEPYLE
jgi:phage repressor protein C with HTH and peptisase S24 domain